MYVQRSLSKGLRNALEYFPAVIITGARQSGKTTFVKNELGDRYAYITLDDPLERDLAKNDPLRFLERYKDLPLIIDEIQYAPQLFTYLKMKIDEKRSSYGRFVLTGSQQFNLMKHLSDTLAGRIAILEMLPFNYLEVEKVKSRPLSQYLWNGFYPEIFLQPQKRDLWLQSYISTYIERDIRQLQNVRDLQRFQDFVALCAATHGQELNIARLAGKCGISQPLCKDWLSLMKATYLVHTLQPFYNNLGKRVIKSPKLYFYDPAIVAYFTRQPGDEALINGAMAGAFFEGFVVNETKKILSDSGQQYDLYFWRSHDGLEVDLLVYLKGSILAVEIKLTSTPTLKHTESIRRFHGLLKSSEKFAGGVLVCNTEKDNQISDTIKILNWRSYLKYIQDILRD